MARRKRVVRDVFVCIFSMRWWWWRRVGFFRRACVYTSARAYTQISRNSVRVVCATRMRRALHLTHAMTAQRQEYSIVIAQCGAGAASAPSSPRSARHRSVCLEESSPRKESAKTRLVRALSFTSRDSSGGGSKKSKKHRQRTEEAVATVATVAAAPSTASFQTHAATFRVVEPPPATATATADRPVGGVARRRAMTLTPTPVAYDGRPDRTKTPDVEPSAPPSPAAAAAAAAAPLTEAEARAKVFERLFILNLEPLHETAASDAAGATRLLINMVQRQPTVIDNNGLDVEFRRILLNVQRNAIKTTAAATTTTTKGILRAPPPPQTPLTPRTAARLSICGMVLGGEATLAATPDYTSDDDGGTSDDDDDDDRPCVVM